MKEKHVNIMIDLMEQEALFDTLQMMSLMNFVNAARKCPYVDGKYRRLCQINNNLDCACETCPFRQTAQPRTRLEMELHTHTSHAVMYGQLYIRTSTLLCEMPRIYCKFNVEQRQLDYCEVNKDKGHINLCNLRMCPYIRNTCSRRK